MTKNGVTKNGTSGASQIPTEAALQPLIFTDEELKGLRVMCDSSVPTCVYDGVMAAVRKIDDYFGRAIRLNEMNLEYIAKHPPVKDMVIETSAPPKGGPVAVEVACKDGHTWTSTTKGGAPADTKCPECRHSWITYRPTK